jgi:hypothetical protein
MSVESTGMSPDSTGSAGGIHGQCGASWLRGIVAAGASRCRGITLPGHCRGITRPGHRAVSMDSTGSCRQNPRAVSVDSTGSVDGFHGQSVDGFHGCRGEFHGQLSVDSTGSVGGIHGQFRKIPRVARPQKKCRQNPRVRGVFRQRRAPPSALPFFRFTPVWAGAPATGHNA